MTSTGQYQVYKSQPGVWYVQRVSDHELVGLPFSTKKAAIAACESRNLPASAKRAGRTLYAV